jgi:sulfatase modifying factor 1
VGERYPWGDIISGLKANYWDSGDPEDNDTNPVASYPANGYGLYDMAGNVTEWVRDWYDSSYYQVSPSVNPQGPATGDARSYRGGSFVSSTDPASGINLTLRVAHRDSLQPYFSFVSIGFRCARSL